jgi:hypothetical protein
VNAEHATGFLLRLFTYPGSRLAHRQTCFSVAYLTTLYSLEWLDRIWKQTVVAYVRFEVFMAATMTKAIFWDVTLCGSCKNWISEEHVASIFREEEITRARKSVRL